MTPLAKILISRVKSTGPISVAEFMAECLMHPKHGYYTTREPFGETGDFTTAPEISQMFGELLGLMLAQVWLDQGSPEEFVLVELGPGRGTLMADVLRATKNVPGFHRSMGIFLVEASDRLRKLQRQTLSEYNPKWVDRIGDIPAAPLFLLANEFFDALPIRQFRRHLDGWQEQMVAYDRDKLALKLTEPKMVTELGDRLLDTEPGEIVETCAPARSIIGEVTTMIAASGGVAIVVDYGELGSRGDTLQAVRKHKYQDVFAEPGKADLTAHVDFAALANAAGKFAQIKLVDQGVLLERLGIKARHAALAANMDGKALVEHDAALERLISSDEMGSLFKAIAIYPNGAPTPPGFAP